MLFVVVVVGIVTVHMFSYAIVCIRIMEVTGDSVEESNEKQKTKSRMAHLHANCNQRSL